MDDKPELEPPVRDIAEARMSECHPFIETNSSAEVDASIMRYRRLFQKYGDSSVLLALGQEYGDIAGHIALTLGMHLVNRFVAASATGRQDSNDLEEAKQLEVYISRHNRNIHNEGHEDYHEWQIFKRFIAYADLMVTIPRLAACTSQLQIYSLQPTSPPTIPSGESTMMTLAISALHEANEETDIVAYAAYCQLLTFCHFSRYQMEKDIIDLEEAVEYSMTAYWLSTDVTKVSFSLITRSITIFRAYMDEHVDNFPHSLNTNFLRTFKELIDYFYETTQSLDSVHQIQTSTSPQTIPSSESIMMKLVISALHDANDETEIAAYAAYCQVLAHCHFSRYQTERDMLDLEEAAGYSVTAFQLFVGTTEVLVSYTLPETMAICYAYLHRHMTEPLLVLSINVLETYENLIDRRFPETITYPALSHVWRFYLAAAYFKAYKYQNDPRCAETAITQYEKAFECQPSHAADPEEWVTLRGMAHYILGLIFIKRYMLSNDSRYIELAINNLHAAEELESGPTPEIMESLGTAFWQRSFLGELTTGTRVWLEDKERGIVYMTAAVQSAARHNKRPHYSIELQLALGAKLMASYLHEPYGNRTDLTRGIQLLEELVPHDSVHHEALIRLAEAYRMRSAEGDRERVSQCCKLLSEDDRRNPRDAQNDDAYLLDLGSKDRDWWKTYAKCCSETPGTRFVSASMWGGMALEQEDPECLQAFGLMNSLLPEYTSILGNKIEDVYRTLRNIQSCGDVAGAAGVKFATGSLAVEWLELYMSVTIRHIYRLRLDVGDLAIQHPDLFETLRKVSEELRQLSQEPVLTTGDFFGTKSYTLQSVYQAHIEEIWRKPGMDQFLRPLPYPQLADAAHYGPVILLSYNKITSSTHAFIVVDPSVEEPITVPLPEASCQVITNLRNKFSKLLNSLGIRHRSTGDDAERQSERAGRVSTKGRDQRNHQFEALLDEIWKIIVKPVFEVLEKNNIRSGRVWWCPAGVLTEFPLHAAVPIDCPYISSYTYGLEVLMSARARLRKISSEQSGLSKQSESSKSQLSVVGIGNYPGRPQLALPSVAHEVQILSNLAEGNAGISLCKLEDNEASVDAVLSALKCSQFIHLACHGTQDKQEPLNSHLVLADGSLDLRNILAEDLKLAGFAFLSVCQTATGESSLSNESAHLAGGFVAAGFKGVVGTMWHIVDEDAPGVVKDVYEAMKTEEGLDITLAAEGLDRAVRRMRISGLPPDHWVPFIHVGV